MLIKTATVFAARGVFTVTLGAALAGSAGIGQMVGPGEIHDAVKAGDVARVTALLDADPALVRARDEVGRTPVHWAARGTSLPILTMVVEKGAEVNVADSGGMRPLHSLASRGNLDGIRLLLDHGADVNLPSAQGHTALHFAALGGQVEAMRVLVSRKADLERADDHGRTPLVLAAREMSGPAVVRALLELGARIDAADKGGDTALSLAAWRGSRDVVGLLLEKRATIPAANTPNARGLLENAVDRGLETLFQRLVEHGADLSIGLGQNRTLLHSAAEGGSVAIVRTLIDRKLELNRKDASGWTPLHYAVDMGRTEAVALLLAQGAEIDARTEMGQSAFNIATENGDADLAALLAGRGADRSAPRFPELRGEYLGQKKPGAMPEIFAPGIVSARYGMHSNVVFSPDGTEAFWSLMIPPRGTGYATGRTLVSRLVDGRWTYPRPAVFDGVPLSDVPFFHPNGRQLFDMSRRPTPGGPPSQDEHIWVWDKGGTDGWTNPRPVDGMVNALPQHWQFSVDRAGTLYFNSTWNGVSGIFRSRLVDGRYAPPESVGERINRGDAEGVFPFIASDGSYLLFTRNRDICVSFRAVDGAWGEPVALGPEFRGMLPVVSSDGRYLFFSRDFRSYWVEASVIERRRRLK